jgi:tetratricopeptide (TPR) repeat protein
MISPSRVTPDRTVLVGTVLAALAYLRDVRYDFILDDYPLIQMNESLESWRNWKMAFVSHIFAVKNSTEPVEFGAVHYRPVYKLWHMLNAHMFGKVLPWWHLTSLLLHIGVILLIYQLAIKVSGERWTAALAALLFAFHPIHVESVAYVSASTDLLVTLFALISILAYFRFREEGASRLYFIASVLAAALAMLSKESAIMFPWLLVAYEALRETRPGTTQNWKRFLWTLPYFVVVGAYLAARTLFFGLNGGPGPAGGRFAALVDTPLVLMVYLHNLIWPFQLSFFYPIEWTSHWTFAKGVAAVMVMGAAFFLWQRYRGRSGVRLQLLWAAILFVPAVLGVSVFVREDWVHDRHMYLASVPVCLIAAALLTDPKLPARASIIASSMLLAILLIDTAMEVPRFSDDVTIYASAVKVAPRNVLLHFFYGEGFWRYGRREEALREYKICTELSPKSVTAHERYGHSLFEVGRYGEAEAEYVKALQWSARPTDFRASILSEIAEAELKRAEFPEAADHLREALQIAPQALNTHGMLAEVLRLQGRTEEADKEMRLEAGVQERFQQEQRASTD